MGAADSKDENAQDVSRDQDEIASPLNAESREAQFQDGIPALAYSEQGEEDEENLIYNENYGEIRVVRSAGSRQAFAVKTRHCTSEEEYTSLLKDVRHLKTLQHPSLLRLGDIRTLQDDGFCGNVYLIKTVVEFLDQDLKQYLQQRQQKKLYFSAPELVTGVLQVLEGLQFLSQKGIYHGNVTTRSIFVWRGQLYNSGSVQQDTEGAQQIEEIELAAAQPLLQSRDTLLKIGIPQLMNQHNHYKRMLLSQEKECFLAPELFSAMGQNNFSPEFGHERTDIFSLGVVTLQMALLDDTDDLYNFSNYTINLDNLQQKLRQIENRYGAELAKTLSELLRPTDKERVNFLEALELFRRLVGSTHQQQQGVTNLLPVTSPSPPARTNLSQQTQASPEKNSIAQAPNPAMAGLQTLTPVKDGTLSKQASLAFQHHSLQRSASPRTNPVEYDSSKPYFQSLSAQQHNLLSHNTANFNKSQTSPVKSIASDRQHSKREELSSSLENLDHLVRAAMQQSKETKQRFESSQQLRGQLRDLLEDEVHVPSQPAALSNSVAGGSQQGSARKQHSLHGNQSNVSAGAGKVHFQQSITGTQSYQQAAGKESYSNGNNNNSKQSLRQSHGAQAPLQQQSSKQLRGSKIAADPQRWKF